MEGVGTGGIVDELGDDLSGDGAEAEAEHGVAGGDLEVIPFASGSEVGEAVGGYGAESGMRGSIGRSSG